MERIRYTTTLRSDLLKELKKLAIDMDKRHNELLEEAIEDLLRKYGRLKGEDSNESGG
jgi:metal-responsive CopG/Arc/MetJ family transcriptional regulator